MNLQCCPSDLLVFSQVRWDSFAQRSHHLLKRHAHYRRVYYIEEPVRGGPRIPTFDLRETSEGVQVMTPYIPNNIPDDKVQQIMKELIDELIYDEGLDDLSVWYDSPETLPYTRHLKPSVIIFDHTAKPTLHEADLFNIADLILTHGEMLFEAKKDLHHNIYPLPQSVDYHHFSRARLELPDPLDQVAIASPRVGFSGIIDETMDMDLVAEIADQRPHYQLIFMGPIKGVSLPVRKNIHYLGEKDYNDLPKYMASWNCSILPYLRDESTRFLATESTLELLAAGRPMVSTPLVEVIHSFEDKNLIHFADDADDFVEAIDAAMETKKEDLDWILRIDQFLKGKTWDEAFVEMARLEIEVKIRKGLFSYSHFKEPLYYLSGAM